MSQGAADCGSDRSVIARRGGKQAKVRQASIEESADESYLLNHRRIREKDEATRRFIMASMQQDRICSVLEERSLARMVDAMEYFEFGKDNCIIQEGRCGSVFFVIDHGSLAVSVNGVACNMMARGAAFGGESLLFKCPRSATVDALEDCGVWGVSGQTFQKVIAEAAVQHYDDNRKMVENIRLFDGLSQKMKDKLGELIVTEYLEPGHRVITAGGHFPAIYFVKKGELRTYRGGAVSASGEFAGGEEVDTLRPGDCLGERALVKEELADVTAVTAGRCELMCISVGDLRDMLGTDLAACLERNLLLLGLRESPYFSQFSSSQQHEIARAASIKDYARGEKLDEGLRYVLVMDGGLTGYTMTQRPTTLERGQWSEDATVARTDSTNTGMYARRNSNHSALGLDPCDITMLTAGPEGARVAVLSKSDLANALAALGLAESGSSAEEASDYTRKVMVAKKVHIFRHLSQEQTDKLVKAFQLQRYRKGAHVIKQGELGSTFFVISYGEVEVLIDGAKVRTMARNAYFGERALLFDEPRTATVEVSSNEAEFWIVEKSTFEKIVMGNMQQALMDRIRLQDTTVTLKEVRQIAVVGVGASGVVRLVQHKETGTRYALKRVKKKRGQIPEEVVRECSLLAENDHPFIMALVKTFETPSSVYMLTELITGGELHAAIRTIPTVLSRSRAQFYTGSLVIVLEELADRSIVYRDLKPENVMLDAQGYLKLIDFGIAKKLDGSHRTFTMIGTPHYMAPEVMRGQGYSTEADLWALGVMQFEFVCGYLPFADELDDPTAVCTAVLKDALAFPPGYKDQHGRALIQGLLTRQPKKRLGGGIDGFEEVKRQAYFKAGHTLSSLFDKIMGRELETPVIPSGETYCDPNDIQSTLSDADELG